MCGTKRRVQAAKRQPAPRARAEGMLEEMSGSAPVPIQALPVKRAEVWVRRTRSHCSSSSGARTACPVRAVRSTITCWATRAASWRSCTSSIALATSQGRRLSRAPGTPSSRSAMIARQATSGVSWPSSPKPAAPLSRGTLPILGTIRLGR